MVDLVNDVDAVAVEEHQPAGMTPLDRAQAVLAMAHHDAARWWRFSRQFAATDTRHKQAARVLGAFVADLRGRVDATKDAASEDDPAILHAFGELLRLMQALDVCLNSDNTGKARREAVRCYLQPEA